MRMKFEPWDDLKGMRDLDSTLREGKRKEFRVEPGWAEPLFCASCGREIGYVSTGSPAVQLCGSCRGTYGSLPLLDPPNVAILCAGGCGKVTASIPREMIGKVVDYCEDCERRMGERPPLQMVSVEEEQRLGVKRSA